MSDKARGLLVGYYAGLLSGWLLACFLLWIEKAR